MWLVSGETGLENYRLVRHKETDAIPDFRDSGCFHNGSSVLDCVQTQQDSIARQIRLTDNATTHVLRLVKSMLKPALKRPMAKDLWESFAHGYQPQDTDDEHGSITFEPDTGDRSRPEVSSKHHVRDCCKAYHLPVSKLQEFLRRLFPGHSDFEIKVGSPCLFVIEHEEMLLTKGQFRNDSYHFDVPRRLSKVTSLLYPIFVRIVLKI